MPKKPNFGQLKVFPEEVLLRIAISLDPDMVKEEYEEGWTKDDIIREIEKHVSRAIGSRNIKGWQYIEDVDILDAVTNIDPESKRIQGTGKMRKVYLSIARDRDTGEYTVLWRQDFPRAKPLESRTYYTSDPIDAVDTLISTGLQASKGNYHPIIQKTKVTRDAFSFWLKSSSRMLNKGEIQLLGNLKEE